MRLTGSTRATGQGDTYQQGSLCAGRFLDRLRHPRYVAPLTTQSGFPVTPPMLLTDSEDVSAGPVEDEAAEPERMVLFVVGQHRFAVPIDRIREIIPARPYTPLPGSGGHVCGLINLRGRIVTVMDLGARLNLPPASRLPEHSIVIVEHRGKLVGMAVEEVARIVAVDPGTLAESAEVLRSLRIDRAYLRGVGEVDDEIFVAVDPDEIFEPILA